jgi:hypothetical protein
MCRKPKAGEQRKVSASTLGRPTPATQMRKAQMVRLVIEKDLQALYASAFTSGIGVDAWGGQVVAENAVCTCMRYNCNFHS